MLFRLDTEKAKKQKSMCFQMEMHQFSKKKKYLRTQYLRFLQKHQFGSVGVKKNASMFI